MAQPHEFKSEPALDIGQRLKFVRESAGFSQRELARRSDVTNGTLSNIEQGRVSPSVQSLEKILRAIPMSLQEFFSEDFSISSAIYREEDFVKIHKDDTDYSILPISEYRSGSAYLSTQTYHPGASVSSEWMVSNGVVSGIVLEGRLSLTLDGTEHELGQNEGFCFSIQRPHKFENKGSRDCILVSVSLTNA